MSDKRQFYQFAPCGPISQMLHLALQGKPRGSRVRLIEDALAAKLGPIYPKLFDRFQILREERHGANGASPEPAPAPAQQSQEETA